jgi:predicted ferric reductase
MLDASRPTAATAVTAANPAAPAAPAPVPTSARVRVPLPRAWGLRPSDAWALLVGNGILIGLMWLRHGGAAELGSAAANLTAIGQVTALYGTYLALVQLVLMGRSPWLDQVFGIDSLARAHRWLGFATIWLILGHVVATTLGYALADQVSPPAELVALLTTYPFVMWALGALVAMSLAAFTSFRFVRRRTGYETWFGLHLYAYLAIALAFMHQLVVGVDFLDDPAARLYWIGMYVAAVSLVLVFRFGQPLVLLARHRFTVGNVVQEAPGVVSIYVTGRDLERLPVRAGQYFNLRLLTRDGWYRAHPFSLSAAPNGRFLRFTVKVLGDWSARLQHLRPGTRVMLEGPYGALTGGRRTRQKVLLVGAGVGITPLRALLEALPGRPGDIALVYRSPRQEDLVFRAELERIAAARGSPVHYVVGRRGAPGVDREPLSPRALAGMVPDLLERDVYLCGPLAMMDEVAGGLRSAGVQPAQIHLERFAY